MKERKTMYREILEKFCKVFNLKMRIIDGVVEDEQSQSLVPIYTVRLLKVQKIGKGRTASSLMFVEGRSYCTATESTTVEKACKRYIELFLLDAKKTASWTQVDEMTQHVLSFPRSSLEALQVFLDMVDLNEKV